MFFNDNLFGELGELTPPSSAHRSPSPSSVLFIGGESTKKLALESVEIIETVILDSMMSNPALQEFSELCELVRRKMHAGEFGSLRDVEKDLWFRGCVSLLFPSLVFLASCADCLFRWRALPALRRCFVLKP